MKNFDLFSLRIEDVVVGPINEHWVYLDPADDDKHPYRARYNDPQDGFHKRLDFIAVTISFILNTEGKMYGKFLKQVVQMSNLLDIVKDTSIEEFNTSLKNEICNRFYEDGKYVGVEDENSKRDHISLNNTNNSVTLTIFASSPGDLDIVENKIRTNLFIPW